MYGSSSLFLQSVCPEGSFYDSTSWTQRHSNVVLPPRSHLASRKKTLIIKKECGNVNKITIWFAVQMLTGMLTLSLCVSHFWAMTLIPEIHGKSHTLVIMCKSPREEAPDLTPAACVMTVLRWSFQSLVDLSQSNWSSLCNTERFQGIYSGLLNSTYSSRESMWPEVKVRVAKCIIGCV